MHSTLLPKYISNINSSNIAWFEKSNNYVFIDNQLKKALNALSNNKDVVNTIKNIYKIKAEEVDNYLLQLYYFLEKCNTEKETLNILPKPLNLNKNYFKICFYTFGTKTIKIKFASEKLFNIINPPISFYLSKKQTDENVIILDEIDNKYYLYHETNFIAGYNFTDYHLLQGKFVIILLKILYNKNEHDWLGIFHASTISYKNNSLMLIGDSGNGKSTFTSLLIANGYKLVSDDVTPISSINLKAYPYPSGISIKEGAFKTVDIFFNNSKTFKLKHNPDNKQLIKFIPSNLDFTDEKKYFCNLVVLVEYKPNLKTDIEITEISSEEALTTLIPDSWISPKNSERFIFWCQQNTYYKIIYKNNNKAIGFIDKLLKDKKF